MLGKHHQILCCFYPTQKFPIVPDYGKHVGNGDKVTLGCNSVGNLKLGRKVWVGWDEN